MTPILRWIGPSRRWPHHLEDGKSHPGKLASGDGQIHPEMGGIFEMPAIPEMGYPIPGCAGAFPDGPRAREHCEWRSTELADARGRITQAHHCSTITLIHASRKRFSLLRGGARTANWDRTQAITCHRSAASAVPPSGLRQGSNTNPCKQRRPRRRRCGVIG